MNEFELIRRYFERAPRDALLGVGDDCALLRPQPGHEIAVTTDTLVEGRHFLPDAEPRALGHKALAVNLSDLAAMGAAPRWALLAIALPDADPKWLAPFAEGLFELAARHGIELVGGDTVRSSLRTLTVTALGELPAGLALRRAGALAGDDIWVSGELGGAALGLVHPDLPDAATRLHRPEPRVELGMRLRGLAHAAIDVSDGLASDLGHVLERSGVGALVHYPSVPRPATLAALGQPQLEQDCVLAGGDDYELLFTAAPAVRGRLEALSVELGLPLTRIGTIRPGAPQLVVLDAASCPMQVRAGFDHFRNG